MKYDDRTNEGCVGDAGAAAVLAIRNIHAALREAGADEKAGIRLERLTGDAAISLFAAEIAEGKSVRAHYHSRGIELYQVLEGTGLMKLGTVENGAVCWTDQKTVSAGDCFAVAEGLAHQLMNTGAGPLRALFCCPGSHLDSDRHFIV